jgi:hypothetical protein
VKVRIVWSIRTERVNQEAILPGKGEACPGVNGVPNLGAENRVRFTYALITRRNQSQAVGARPDGSGRDYHEESYLPVTAFR